MTPYGIVYKDNLYALEQSCLVWQKKFGVLRASSFIKIALINLVISFLINIIGSIIDDTDFNYFFVISILVIAFVLILIEYFTAKNIYVKQMAKGSMVLHQKQAVLFDNRIEFTLPYAKTVFYYDEILYCEEKTGIVTIILDKGMLPVSIYRACVGKGSYDEFTRILKDILGSRYVRKDGNV